MKLTKAEKKMIIGFILVTCIFSFALFKVVKGIEEVGLKSIITTLWEGKK